MQSPGGNEKEQQGSEGSSSGELTKEQLVVKCKNLLSIAQKAKAARDDALSENSNLKVELKQINETLNATKKQYDTAQEMLAVLTDQKLKLAMEIDDMKKERTKTTGEVNLLFSVKQKCEAELEGIKKELEKCKKEKDNALQSLQKVQKRDDQTEEDIKKMKENHEKMLQICSKDQEDMKNLEKLLDETSLKLKQLENERENFFASYSEKYNVNIKDFDSLMASVENTSMSKSNEELSRLESDKVVRLEAELESAKADNDKIAQTLEEVQIETNRLIENSEQLNGELEALKIEKTKLETDLNNTRTENESIFQKLKTSEEENHNLKSNLQAYIEKLNEVASNENKSDKEKSEFLEKFQQNELELSRTKEEKIDIESQLNSLSVRLQEYEKEISKFQTENKDLKNVLNDLERDQDERDNFFRSEKEKLLSEINSWKSKCEEYELECTKFSNESEQLLFELNESKIKCEEHEKEKQETAKSNEKFEILNQNCIDLKNQIIVKDGLIENLNIKIQQLESQHKILNEEKETSTVNFSTIKEEKEKLLKNIEELKTQISDKDIQIKNSNRKFQDLENQLRLLNEENQKLKIGSEEASDLNEELKALKEEKENLLKNIEELKTQISDKDIQIKNSNRKFQDFVNQLNLERALNEEDQKLKIDKASDINEELKALKEEKENLLKNIEELKTQISDKDIQIKNSNRKFQDFVNQLNLERALNEEDQKLKIDKASDINEELKALKEEKDKLLKDINCLNENSKEFNNQILNKENEIKKLLIGLKSSKEECSELKKMVETLSKEKSELEIKLDEYIKNVEQKDVIIVNLESKISKLDEEIVNKKNDEVEILKNKIVEMDETNKELLSQVEAMNTNLTQVNQDHKETLMKRNEEKSKLSKQINDLQELVNFKTLELEEVNKIWAGRLKTIKVTAKGVEKSMREVGTMSDQLRKQFLERLKSLQTEIQDSVVKVLEIEAANTKHELLDEMQCMNQELKERGEVISNLQESHKEELMKNEESRKECNELQNRIKEFEETLENKELQIKELENELIKIKDIKDSVADVDVLSTSTISRTEDNLRLKDFEESFEEKYVKLKMFAVKLKKRLVESNQQLESEKAKFNTEKSELIDKIQHLSTAAKNVQKVQESFDQALDEMELLKKEKTSLNNTLKEVQKNEEILKNQIATLENSNQHLPNMKKQIDSLNAALKEAKNETNKVDNERKVEVMKYVEANKQVKILESKIQELTSSLDQAVKQGKSNNVLELEMKHYEKICSDLTAQLNSEKSKNVALTEENASLIAVKKSLNDQIQMLESQIKSEEERVENIKQQLSSSKEKNENISSNVEALHSQIVELKHELNLSKNSSEQTTQEMSSIISEYSRKEIAMQNKIDALLAHAQSLETTLASTKQELNTSKSEIENLRQEFDAYRLRAQSTLAKQKGEGVSQSEKEARELIDKLKTEVEAFREKMESALAEVESLTNTVSNLQTEKGRVEKKYEDVSKVLHQKITDYDTLMTEYKTFKLSSDTILQNHKTQYETKQESLLKELAELQETIINLKYDLNEKESENKNSPMIRSLDDTILQEREDAEGSESIPTPNTRRLSTIVPLDVLLNNPIDDESQVPVLQNEILKLKNELGTYQVRTRHLSALLSEAEKDAARSSHQNMILKEEVRRIERSLERQPHIANTEYLKNVVFKFLTLQGGDEKGRLVPVLDTILKLSPEETHKLQAVAKGEGTWGSYLPSWTGL